VVYFSNYQRHHLYQNQNHRLEHCHKIPIHHHSKMTFPSYTTSGERQNNTFW
jgi:hypothetical protein